MASSMISSERRRPSEAAPARMQPLSRLPVFFALAGKRVVVAGGNAAAAWKVELLAAAGAAVEVFAPQPCEELLRDRAAIRRRFGRDFSTAMARGDARWSSRSPSAHSTTRARPRAFIAAGTRRRRAVQRHRQAGILRFLFRRHRQPFADGGRDLDRRRGAGIRASDPQPHRGDAAGGLCALGRRPRATGATR